MDSRREVEEEDGKSTSSFFSAKIIIIIEGEIVDPIPKD